MTSPPSTLNLPPIPPMLLSNIEKSAAALHRCKRAVFITGAGISVNAGIPDFRSDQGLYAQLKRKYPKALFKGNDLFDASLYRDENLTQLYFSFIAEFKKLVNQAKETHTHRFLHSLSQQGKLLRCYTQNIDGLEFLDTLSSHPFVQLHGTLNEVVCSVCHSHHPFLKQYIDQYQVGDPPLCPQCVHVDAARQQKQQRHRPLGVLKPAVVLYNETHPQGDWIAECVAKDLRKKPDLLVVMGTSLKVHGVKQMVRALAHAVHQQKRGLVILVNRTPLPQKEWGNLFDVVFTEDADTMVKRWAAWMHVYQQRTRSVAARRGGRAGGTLLGQSVAYEVPSVAESGEVQGRCQEAEDKKSRKNKKSTTVNGLSSQPPPTPTPLLRKENQNPSSSSSSSSSSFSSSSSSSSSASVKVIPIRPSSKKTTRSGSIEAFGFPVVKDSSAPSFSKRRKIGSNC